MKRNSRKMYLALFVLMCFLGIGYAFLQTELQINGTADFLGANWNIHFNNLVVNPDSVELSSGNTAATISESTTEVTYAITLKEPGDFYEFTVDAVNKGTIDGMVESVTSKMNGVEITTLPAYMEYSVTYSDGIELAPNQYLKTGETETYKVRIGYKANINASDLPAQTQNKTFSFSVTYVQADENAKIRPKTFADDDWSTIINAVQTGNTSAYHVGDTKTVTLRNSLGTHTIRIANTSTPAECSTEGFSQTACGFVLEFADIITTHNINSTATNVGGWPASAMRTYLNTETTGIYNSLPSEIKSGIIDTTVVSGHGSTSGEANFTSTDKLFLLSAHEVWVDDDGNTSSGLDYYDTAYNNTRQLDYYANLGVTTSNYSGAIKQRNGSNSYWWLRSAVSNTVNSFRSVYNNGNWYTDYANPTLGVSPAFRIA